MWTNPCHSHCQLSLHEQPSFFSSPSQTHSHPFLQSLASNWLLPASALLSLSRNKWTTLYISTPYISMLYILLRFDRVLDRVNILPLVHACLDHTRSHRNQHITCLPHAFLLDRPSWREDMNRIKINSVFLSLPHPQWCRKQALTTPIDVKRDYH